jgi:hypothetical protein
MNTGKLAFIIILLMTLSSHICYSQKKVEIMQPKVEFDIKQATELLNTGTAEIRGTAYYEGKAPITGIKIGDKWYARAGSVVFLYPLTAYVEEYLELKKKNKQGKRIATVSPLANSYRIEAKVYNDKGEFVFPGLKAGKYYLETEINENLLVFEASGIVEIKNDNEKVEYKLKHTYHQKM